MVDLGVQVVLLSCRAQARDDVLFAVAAWVRFRLFSVWKHSGVN